MQLLSYLYLLDASLGSCVYDWVGCISRSKIVDLVDKTTNVNGVLECLGLIFPWESRLSILILLGLDSCCVIAICLRSKLDVAGDRTPLSIRSFFKVLNKVSLRKVCIIVVSRLITPVCVSWIIQHDIWSCRDPTLVQICFWFDKWPITIDISSWLERAIRTSCSALKLSVLLRSRMRLICRPDYMWLYPYLSISVACMSSIAINMKNTILLYLLFASILLNHTIIALSICKSWALLALLIKVALSRLTSTDVLLNLFSDPCSSHKAFLFLVLWLSWHIFLYIVSPIEILTCCQRICTDLEVGRRWRCMIQNYFVVLVRWILCRLLPSSLLHWYLLIVVHWVLRAWIVQRIHSICTKNTLVKLPLHVYVSFWAQLSIFSQRLVLLGPLKGVKTVPIDTSNESISSFLAHCNSCYSWVDILVRCHKIVV